MAVPEPSTLTLPSPPRGEGSGRRIEATSHALEQAVGGHRCERLLVTLDRALDVRVRVHGGDQAVMRRPVDAVVEQRATETMVELAALRAIEAGEAGLALERHVENRRLAEARAGNAPTLHHIG